MLAVTDHCAERYANRIVGIDDTKESKRYAVQNRDMIVKNCNKMYKYSQKIYTGNINGDKTTKHYYLSDDIILVVNTKKTCIITLYKVDWGYPRENTRVALESVVKQLQLSHKKAKEVKRDLDNVRRQRDQVAQEIKDLRSRLQDLENQHAELDKSVRQQQRKTRYLSDKIDREALLLCDSFRYVDMDQKSG